MQNFNIKIGSRGSDLALWQAHHFQNMLADAGFTSEVVIISTKGDQIQNLSFDKIEGKGFFTKELEDALLAGTIDVAVHSLKDLPTEQPHGLVIGGLSARADARDVMLIRSSAPIRHIKEYIHKPFVIGTSSLRRKSQMKTLFPQAQFCDIRGNVPTRIRKMEEGECDAIVLAKAGLDRLGIDIDLYKGFAFDVTECVPAPGQGVLAFQTTSDNIRIRKILKNLHIDQVARCTNIERGVLNALEGGCLLPLGVHVYQDTLGNYISHTSFELKNGRNFRTKVSQNTFEGMKEEIINQIKEAQTASKDQ